MRTQIVFYYLLLDIAYPEFSDTDGELDDCDEDNRVVEGEKKHIFAIKQNYQELNYMMSRFLVFPFW